MGGRHRTPSRDVSSPRRRLWTVVGVAVAVVLVAVGAAVRLSGHHDDVEPAQQTASRMSAHQVESRLRSSFDAIEFTAAVGVALVPVGGGVPMLFGDQTVRDAWSTIKAPLGLAAERRHGMSRTEANAVIDSDNASARILTRSLGTPAEASAALTEVLREGGDTTTVPAPSRGGRHPMLGETQWALADSATWTANLPCMTGSDHILELMNDVADVQKWGIRRLGLDRTAVKGGWGQAPDGGYEVRQIGVVTLHDGSQLAVSASTHARKMTFDQGTETLDRVAAWLRSEFDVLRGGRCR
ncbi:hypothetical protein nbrc107696_38550 [Gordonia spumicola]|uniref:Serine hydrolase n=1 Tax=Gordonia spumicola TaxID=589161 RepID=A0A7I9VDI5_9ACTN|nr:hypothetical protein [Gordonia spumicola]GEE03409.1 hypothetical protein nbrc107696_38550 [Gordonia spumicola]